VCLADRGGVVQALAHHFAGMPVVLGALAVAAGVLALLVK
jgi:hypothetical protein